MWRSAAFVALLGCSSSNSAHVDASAGDSREPADAAGDAIAAHDSAGAIDASADASTIDSACGICPSETPICDGTTCRGCIADAECPTGACNEAQGLCLAEADVLFVTTTGSDGGTCTRAQPCATISYASTLLADPIDTIAVGSGTFPDTIAFIDQPVLLSGPTLGQDAAIAYINTGSSHPILQFFGSDAYVEGLAIAGGDTAEAAVSVTGTAVTFDRVAIHDNGHVGLLVASNGSAVVTRSLLFGNADDAVVAQGPLDVERTFLHDNGIAVVSETATLRNSIFANNTTHIEAISGTTIADFDTFASATSTAIASAATVIVTDSIMAQTSSVSTGSVTFAFTMFTGTPPTGTMNFQGQPLFVNAAGEDFHITAASPAIDHANGSSTVAIDFDGQVRPHGAASDCGADEFY